MEYKSGFQIRNNESGLVDSLMRPYKYDEFKEFYFRQYPYLQSKSATDFSIEFMMDETAEPTQRLLSAFEKKFSSRAELEVWQNGKQFPKPDWSLVEHDTFILQAQSSSEISLKNPQNEYQSTEGLGALTSFCTLNAGDWIYVPRGWMKKTNPSPTSKGLVIRLV